MTLERAVIEVVATRGYAHTTVPDVCAHAAVSVDTFERHFADMESAYCSVFAAVLRQSFDRLLPVFEAHEQWSDRIRAVAYELFAFAAEDRPRGLFMAVEVFAAGERAQALRDEGMDLLIELIDQGRLEMEDPAALTRATAEAIVGSTFQAVRTALEEGTMDPFGLLPKLMYSATAPYVGSAAALRELTVIPPFTLTATRVVGRADN